MSYLSSFLAREEKAQESARAYPEEPTKPTKLGCVSSVGGQNHTRGENGGASNPARAYPEPLTKPTEPPIPDRSAWRSVVAAWPIERRQGWADLAEQHQVEGKGWKEAEWLAFQRSVDPEAN
jgi:hypothetical protein